MIKKIFRKFKKNKNNYGKNVSISKNVSLSSNITMYKTAPITIGEHTMIGCNVIIHTSTHNYNSHPMWLKRIDRPVKIGKHVWIGAGAIILPGIKIGDYSVVGAGSVVTAHVPIGAIAVGNPARIIKYRDLKKIKNIKKTPDYPNNSCIVSEHFLDDSKICKNIK